MKNRTLMALIGALTFLVFSPRLDTTVVKSTQAISGAGLGFPNDVDKWALWVGGSHLRGANIYQRRVYPELDMDLLGSGPVGPPYLQDDFDRLAALGANFVNISHPGLFTEEPPFTPDPQMVANLDHLLDLIVQADMFAVIAFRTGPGRSEFTFVWSQVGTWFDESYLNDSLWADPDAQAAWAEMWAFTAARYSGNPVVVGYDLMVEPNSNEVGSHALEDRLDIWTPEVFYREYGGTLYDWNQLYPEITAAVREVDQQTPILVGGNGYSGIDWLPYLSPTGDPRTVYSFHQYQPFTYTHQLSTTLGVTYPGYFDTDFDGKPEVFDRTWLENRLSSADLFQAAHQVPLAANEFGVVRYAPNAAGYIQDQLDLLENRGIGNAVWLWNPSFEPFASAVDAFDFMHGSDPFHHEDIPESELVQVLSGSWSHNVFRPSSPPMAAAYLPLLLAGSGVPQPARNAGDGELMIGQRSAPKSPRFAPLLRWYIPVR